MTKLALAVIAVCFLSVTCSPGAFAASKVTLTQEDPQGYFWDAVSSQKGGSVLEMNQAFVPNESSQAFAWTPVSGVTNGYTVCSLKICLSDSGKGTVAMSGKADVFTITSKSAALDMSTGRYIMQPSKPGNGAVILMGKTPVSWTFALAGSGSGSGGGGGGGQIRIMPLGDSITEGWATWPTFTQGGYRCPLALLLQRRGTSFSFAGNSAALEPGVVTGCSQVNWEGHGGYDIAGIQRFEDADGSVRVLQPQIVLLLAGTNDVAQGETGSIPGQLSNMLSNIFAQDPSAWVIVSTIPPMNARASAAISSVASWSTQVVHANAEIRAITARFPRASLIDYYAATVSNVNANIGTDGIHPSVTGYGILADLWYNAIVAHLASE